MKLPTVYLGQAYSIFKSTLQSVFNDTSRGSYGGFMGRILEPFAGAWQQGVTIEPVQNVLGFSAVHSCIALISNDISKLCIDLIEFIEDPTVNLVKSKKVKGQWLQTKEGHWEEVDNPATPFLAVLYKPNHYQTRIQFINQWICAKLVYGNAYILKERDKRGVVVALYVLDSRTVMPLVASNGEVFYQIAKDYLAGIEDAVQIPASEIIHDRMFCLWHPLIGISPIFACGIAATQGLRIQANSNTFFGNMSRPSGQLTSPDVITDETAEMLKKRFEENFSGGKIGRLLVAGSGLKYEPMAMTASDAQMIEQLRWTVEDVARCFMVPEYKIATPASGRAPAANIAQLNQDYYNQTLQIHIESIEALLDEGLSLPDKYQIQMDLEGLLRMDPLSQAEQLKAGIAGGYLSPNEARGSLNLPPVVGGESPMIQQQNYSLAALAKRDASADPFKIAPAPAQVDNKPPIALPAPAKSAEEEMFEFLSYLQVRVKGELNG